MQTLKEYNADVDTYLEVPGVRGEAESSERRRPGEDAQHAVDTLQKVAAKFNEQVRTFKSKKG